MSLTLPKQLCQMEEVTWDDVCNDVKAVNEALYEIIESIPAKKRKPLVRARYRYGAYIAFEGEFSLPHRDSASAEIIEQLKVCAPLALQLSLSSEMFIEAHDRVMPLDMFFPGELFGAFEAANTLTGQTARPVWTITAGARSCFMLPKITDSRSHKRIMMEFGCSEAAPATLPEQWPVFSRIAASVAEKDAWISEVILFTEPWLVPQADDLGWLRFHNYLLQWCWGRTKHMRARTEFNMMWEDFAAAIRQRNLKPGPYLVDTVKHLLFMANGYVPGYRAADVSNLSMPVALLESAYEDVYQLKEYAPTIMHAVRLDQCPQNVPIYYSLGYPTLLEGTPTIRKAPSVITELREVKKLLMTLEKVLTQGGEMHRAFQAQTQFDYFHSEEDMFGEISPLEELAAQDPIIQDSLTGRFKGKEFPSFGHFLRGCIRLTRSGSDG